jgi:hypothetical protein
MQFTTIIKNKLTDTEYTFEEWFGLEECFDKSKATFDLIVKTLDVQDPDFYESVDELIEYFDEDLEKYIEIIKIEDFGTEIDSTKATYYEICDLYDLDVEIEKIKAYKEYQGSINVTDIIDTNWDEINLYRNIDDNDDLGHYIVEELYCGISELSKEQLENYFDYEAFGRDYALTGGSFTSEGYIEIN